MRRAEVYHKQFLAGELIEKNRNQYIFRYDHRYYANPDLPAISLTLPKNKQEHVSEYMFPFFCNMLAEGANLAIQSRELKIDENDILRLLGATAISDTIGAVTIKLIEIE